ncbi:hypothetical protein U2F10_11210 [Leptothoe sp. EHU-05/26/07-4]
MVLNVSISSPPDREYLVADIMLDDSLQIAEVNIGSGTLEIEIYEHPERIPWSLDFEEFYTAMKQAKLSLQEVYEKND